MQGSNDLIVTMADIRIWYIYLSFIFIELYIPINGTALAYYYITINKRRKAMVALWIIIGCLFLTGIGIRFMYRVLGLSPAEATAVFILIVALVGINSGPARQFIAQIF